MERLRNRKKNLLLTVATFSTMAFSGAFAQRYNPANNTVGQLGVEVPGLAADDPVLSAEEFERGKGIFFERCAGCHGVLRKGATGKALTTDLTRDLGYDCLHSFITYGSPAGMPNWGTSGKLSDDDVALMAKYLLIDPPQPSESGMPQIRDSWSLLVPPDQRPTEKSQ